jgi:uroporphyrinogen decarboxylase
MEDEWGTIWGFGSIVGVIGEPLEHPIKSVVDIKNYKLPDPEAPGCLDRLEEIIEKNKDKYISVVLQFTLFERLHFLMGYNEALLAMMTNLKEVEPLLDKIMEYNIKMIKRFARTFNGRIHGIVGADDWGTQTNLMISPEMWRKIFKPRYKMIADEAHSNGYDYWFHSDGKIEDIIPDMIELGIDVFQLPQPSSVLGIKEFGERFAGKACHCLYVDLQSTFVSGTEEQIIKEAKDLVNYWSNEYGSGIIATDYHDPKSIGTKVENSKIALKAYKEAWESKVKKYREKMAK